MSCAGGAHLRFFRGRTLSALIKACSSRVRPDAYRAHGADEALRMPIPLKEVDRGRHSNGECDPGIPVIALQDQHEDRHEAGEDGAEPSDPAESHGGYSRRRRGCCRAVRRERGRFGCRKLRRNARARAVRIQIAWRESGARHPCEGHERPPTVLVSIVPAHSEGGASDEI